MQKTVFLIPVILLIFSCKTTVKNMAAQPPLNDTLADLSFKKIIKDKEFFTATTEILPLDTIYTAKDTLHILTSKIKGCEADKFQLMWNGAWMKSMPPQASIKLFQLAAPDCKEAHNFHLTFNLKPMRMKQDTAVAVVDTTEKKLLLRISGWKTAVAYVY